MSDLAPNAPNAPKVMAEISVLDQQSACVL
jgi:hypothetical protein